MYKQYKDKEERTFRCLLYAYGKVTDKIEKRYLDNQRY